jgi:hypothetical protein
MRGVGLLADREYQERAARNQSLFREVNERIRGLPDRPPAVYELFICECHRDGCTEPISLTMAEYEAIRSDPTRFVVTPGHFDPKVETCVHAQDGRFQVVEKIERSAEVAERLDPRGSE